MPYSQNLEARKKYINKKEKGYISGFVCESSGSNSGVAEVLVL